MTGCFCNLIGSQQCNLFINFSKSHLFKNSQNGVKNVCNKVAIELRVVLFWSEILPVISNETLTAPSFNFEITLIISDQIALHSVQLPLLMQ